MPRKKFIDKQYYWVRRARTGDSYPNWEPMLWDAAPGRFFTRGDTAGCLPASLVDIGEAIERRLPRAKKRMWAATDFDRRKLKVSAVGGTFAKMSEARQMGNGPPIRVEVSWSRHALNALSADERKKEGR